MVYVQQHNQIKIPGFQPTKASNWLFIIYPGSRSKDMPQMWNHAQLESLRLFLKEEQERGNYTPHLGLPL